MGCNIPTVGMVKAMIQYGHEVDVLSSSLADVRIKNMFDFPGVKYMDVDISRFSEYFKGREISIVDDGMIFSALILDAIDYADNYDVVIYDYFLFPLYYLKDRGICTIRHFANFAFERNLIKRMFEGDDAKMFQNTHILNVSKDVFREVGNAGIKFNYSSVGEEILNNVCDCNIVHTIRELQPYSEAFDSRFNFVGSSGGEFKSKTPQIPFEKMSGTIVYISFGTVVSLVGDCRRDILNGIIREFGNSEYSIIMSVGLSIDLSEFKNVPDNIYIYQFVKQTEVLKYADLFVTHGGQNSTNESIYYGVPMIVIPGSYDQVVTAEFVESSQLGYELEESKFTPQKLRNMVESILNNPIISQKVDSYQKKMLEINSDEEVVHIIEEYVKTKKGK